MKNYYLMKQKIGIMNLNEENIMDFVEKNNLGELDLFKNMIENLANSITYTIDDLQKKFSEENEKRD